MILVLIILLICSFTFAELKPWVNYSSDSVDSHACIPGNSFCAYINVISIDKNYFSDISDPLGVKIFGLSKDSFFPGTNSHVEIANDLGNSSIGEYTNYSDYNIYLKLAGASKCLFKKNGAPCGVGNGECVFGLSGETNAHISKCDTFGNNEIKLCCNFETHTTIVPITPVRPDDGSCEITYFEVEDIDVNDPIKITYACSSQADINIILFDSIGNPIPTPVYSNPCVINHTVYDGYTFAASEQIVIARINTNNCTKEKFFTVKAKKETAIPDNNLFLVCVVVGIIGFIVIKKKD